MFGTQPEQTSTTVEGSKSSAKKKKNKIPEVQEIVATPPPQPSFGEAMSFHITDLLEQSMVTAREKNNMKATIDFYKRSVKPEAELNMRKEIIIKNYRLRIVDANVDITENDRRIMRLNKGTSIYVANSLIKPEIYRYSTKVSNMITELFPFLNDEE